MRLLKAAHNTTSLMGHAHQFPAIVLYYKVENVGFWWALSHLYKSATPWLPNIQAHFIFEI